MNQRRKFEVVADVFFGSGNLRQSQHLGFVVGVECQLVFGSGADDVEGFLIKGAIGRRQDSLSSLPLGAVGGADPGIVHIAGAVEIYQVSFAVGVFDLGLMIFKA
jgi:hypothetical protein